MHPRHVLRNSLIPVITLAGLSLPQIFGGALIVESLFNIEGVGWRLWQAALKHDFPVLLGFILVDRGSGRCSARCSPMSAT